MHRAMTHPPNPPPVIRAAEHARLRQQLVDQLVDGGHRDPVVGSQAPVALGHDRPEGDQVPPGEHPLGLSDPGTLGHHVARPPPQHRVAQLAQVAKRAQPERSPEHVRRPLALGPPRGVR